MVAARVLSLRSGVLGTLGALGGAERGRPGDREGDAGETGLPRGRLIELAGGPTAARTSAAVQILVETQREGDPVVWIQPRGGTLYPPDLAAAGIDLGALLVVHVPPEAGRAGQAKAAELVLRSGAFGALVLDLCDAEPPRGDAWLGRLASLAREHDSRCVFLTSQADSSLGPLIALRLLALRRRSRFGRFRLELDVLKDKSGCRPSLPGPRAWVGPDGMP